MLRKGDVVRHWFAGVGRVIVPQRSPRDRVVRVLWNRSGQTGGAYAADCRLVRAAEPQDDSHD